MKEDKTIYATGITISETWQPLFQFRFLVKHKGTGETNEIPEKNLQQLFQSNLGYFEWRDIPIEFETL